MINKLITIVFNIFTPRGGKRIRSISGVSIIMGKNTESRQTGGGMGWKGVRGGGGGGLVWNRVGRSVPRRSQRVTAAHSSFAQADPRSPTRLRSQGGADGAGQKGENRG